MYKFNWKSEMLLSSPQRSRLISLTWPQAFWILRDLSFLSPASGSTSVWVLSSSSFLMSDFCYWQQFPSTCCSQSRPLSLLPLHCSETLLCSGPCLDPELGRVPVSSPRLYATEINETSDWSQLHHSLAQRPHGHISLSANSHRVVRINSSADEQLLVYMAAH